MTERICTPHLVLHVDKQKVFARAHHVAVPLGHLFNENAVDNLLPEWKWEWMELVAVFCDRQRLEAK
jgi:hypothetical protein